jgi:hypothetical protein
MFDRVTFHTTQATSDRPPMKATPTKMTPVKLTPPRHTPVKPTRGS